MSEANKANNQTTKVTTARSALSSKAVKPTTDNLIVLSLSIVGGILLSKYIL